MNAILATAIMVFSAQNSTQPKPEFGTFEVDVVTLIDSGTKVAGKSQFFEDRYGYRYFFESAESQSRFRLSPAKYEVQLGGACGKMAELSGRGSTSNFWVYQGKLYVFASNGCRESFRANPEGFLEENDAKPTGDVASAREGKRLIQLAAKHHGFDKLGAGVQIQTTMAANQKFGDRTYAVVARKWVGINGNYFEQTTYDGSGYGYEIIDGKGFEVDPKGKRTPVVPAWQSALDRKRAREPAFLLAMAKSNKLIAISKQGTSKLATVKVHIDGSTSELEIERDSGKILSLTTMGRNSKSVLGIVKRVFTGYSTESGVTYPTSFQAIFDGEPSPSHSQSNLSLSILATK